ncbi:MAG: hypothetical protein H6Q86_5974 [candidate division NC10 bacterium]|nr:hypothetical protein [candidate division NC10 bacterium]
MNRRDCLKAMAGLSAGAVFPWGGGAHASQARGEVGSLALGRATRVVLGGVGREASDETVASAVRAAAEAATDFSWLSRGDAVFLKPALNSGNPYPATTSPTGLAAMVKILKERGAGRVVVGDMAGILHVKLSPGGVSGSSRRLMEASGMARAVVEAGAELHFFEEAGWDAFYEDTPAAGSHWKRGLMMPRVLTLGLKAAVGYWRTDTRLEYHRDASSFQEKTAEGNTVDTLRQKQRLVLTVADKVLTTFGPDEGHVVRPATGLVIASESVVAHDMVSLAWLLDNRRDLPASEDDALSDPYKSQLFVSIGNHWVVNKLDGLGAALTSERLTRNDINAVWDDRVLSHAHRVFGGLPRVVLETANDAAPEDVKRRLSEMTTPSA